MAKRSQYVTQGYLEEIEHYIYNDIPLKNLYKRYDVSIKFDEQAIKEMLLPQEQYVQLEGNIDFCCITNYAKVLNSHKKSQYSVKFGVLNCHLYVAGEKILFDDIFKQQGWDYNIPELYNRYIKNGWKYTKYKLD